MAATSSSEGKDVQVHVSGSESKGLGPSRLVLCFDGTGNQYKGDTSDTNIVKLYQKFDRSVPNQFHYYQRKSEQALILP